MWARLAVVWLLLAGCSGIQKTIREPASRLALTAVFVLPVRFAGTNEPAWRSFALSQRMIDLGVREAGDALEFYGPGEFRVLKTDSDDGWVATTALPLLTSAGSRADQGVLLRPSVEKRVASLNRETQDAKGRAAGGAATEETTWVCRVEVLHPSSRTVLVEVSGQVTVDPFAEPTPEQDFDPAPPLTHLLEKLTQEAVGVAAKYASQRSVAADPGLTLAMTPAAALAFEDERPSAALDLAVLDALAQELFTQNLTRFLTPWLTDAEVAKVAKRPSGLLVVSAPARSKVQPGELIERVDGQVALPQSLARLRFRGAPVQLQLRHPDGSSGEVVFP